MRSMTGYGRGSANATEQGLIVEIEITSVNRKNLDTFVSAPREWSGIEQRCNDWIKSGFQRGRVNIQIKVNSIEGEQHGLTWCERALDETLLRLKKFADSRELPFIPDAPLLLDLAKSLKDSSGHPDWSDFEAAIKTAFDQALGDINLMRSQEGSALAEDLNQRIDQLNDLRLKIEKYAQGAVHKHRDALLERLKHLNLDLDLDDERVLKELALFADRCDISEEMTRLASHFEQFKGFIRSGEPAGRKMDFLCQEIHRELNTTGSKSSQIEITRAVIEGKNGLERIREQVQNIE